MKVGIIGLGLMGGSMGLALKGLRERTDIDSDTHIKISRIWGYDSNALHLQQALNLGLVDEGVSLESIWQCDVVFLAVPVGGIIALLNGIKQGQINKNITIIDVGGAKCEVLKAVPKWLRTHFIGAHPMCGTEFFGPKAAIEGLYSNNIVILTDLEQSGAVQVEMAKDIFIGIGMKILQMSAKEHDKHVALISHMPHILSYALANATLAQENPQMILALVGGGFRSMSRISKSSPLMWRDIFKHNKDNVLAAMEHFEAAFKEAKALIEQEKWDELEAFMANANSLQKFL